MLYPIFFLITYLYPSFWIIRNIVTEKEKGIRETLKTMVRSPLFHYGLGLEGFSSRLFLVGDILRRVYHHFGWMHVDAEEGVRVLQPLLVLLVLRVLLVRYDDAMLSHHLLLLESKDCRSLGNSHHLHNVRSFHSV